MYRPEFPLKLRCQLSVCVHLHIVTFMPKPYCYVHVQALLLRSCPSLIVTFLALTHKQYNVRNETLYGLT